MVIYREAWEAGSKTYTLVLCVHNEYGNSDSKTSGVVRLKLNDCLLEILQKLGRTVNSKAPFRLVYCDSMFVEEKVNKVDVLAKIL